MESEMISHTSHLHPPLQNHAVAEVKCLPLMQKGGWALKIGGYGSLTV